MYCVPCCLRVREGGEREFGIDSAQHLKGLLKLVEFLDPQYRFRRQSTSHFFVQQNWPNCKHQMRSNL